MSEHEEKTRPRQPESTLRRSWGFPSFAQDFPAHPELDELVAAFARGDYATVRARAPKLAAETDDDAVKAAALKLRARIEPDPTAKVIFVLAALLITFLSGYWASHDGPPKGEPAPTKPVPTVEHPN